MNEIRKTLAAVLTGLIGWGTAVVQSSSTSVTATEWIALATVFVTALAVYLVPNADPKA